VKQLRDGGVYSLSLTPYQYTARRYTGVHRDTIAWVLVPEFQYSSLICGPALFVAHDGTIGRSEGTTALTTNDLDFTGRYKT
jgi:hypothetical protein